MNVTEHKAAHAEPPKWNRDNLPPLTPSVKIGQWRQDDPANEFADIAYARVRRQALDRDGYSCAYCEFHASPNNDAPPMSLEASGFLEVHHIDDDHQNNDLQNLVTLCPACHQIFHLGYAGHAGKARLVYCPWLTQAELNQTVILAGILKFQNKSPELAQRATALLAMFDSLESVLADTYSENFADPAKMASALGRMRRQSPKLYETRSRIFDEVKVLPIVTRFQTQFDYWIKFSCWTGNNFWVRKFDSIYSLWTGIETNGVF